MTRDQALDEAVRRVTDKEDRYNPIVAVAAGKIYRSAWLRDAAIRAEFRRIMAEAA